jgi:hypothetical protein
MSFAASSTPFAPHLVTSQHRMTLDDEMELELEEEGVILAAKALFDMREYNRVSKQVVGCQSAKARFLGLYSRYLVCSRFHCEAPR